MIHLYTWTTPNGRKISIMLEEIGLAYQLRPVNLDRNEQFAPEYLRICPNNKIPAIVDASAGQGPITVFESGAVLTYLAEKTGQLLPPAGAARYGVLEWLHWSNAGLGPMLGQLVHFASAAEQVPPALERFTHEAERLLGVMERRLAGSRYLGGETYSIADIAAYPWTLMATTTLGALLSPSLATKPATHRWLETLGNRPAVARGMDIPPHA